RRLRDGQLIVVDERGAAHHVGQPSDVHVTVTVRAPAAWRAVLTRGSVGLGLSYAYGWWDCDDLVALVRIAARGLEDTRRPPVGLDRFTPRGEDKELDRRNIRAHYDLRSEEHTSELQ